MARCSVVDRRRFLQLSASAGLGLAVAGTPAASALGRTATRSIATGAPYEPVPAFPAGVISGDPTSGAVLLWTRIDPALTKATQVAWELSRSSTFEAGSVLASGTVTTATADDHTVHVEATGLQPATTYWYRFTAGGVTSPVGRTRTLPAGDVDHLRIAYFSCQRYVHGYYNAHADLAGRAHDPATDVDLVICLGDYVYESGPADDVVVPGRTDPDSPQVTLEDYRRQYHLYRTDMDLQAMHAAYPFVAIFDNHDGFSGPTDPQGPGARAAFFEQIPVRRSAEDPNRQYRSFALGSLCELFMLDERQYRDPTPSNDAGPLGPTTLEQPLMVEPGRTMLGETQREWLLGGLERSSAAWKILGSQLVFAPLRAERDAATQATAGDGPQQNAGRYVNLIGWDGYQAERRQIVDRIHGSNIEGVVVIAGDSHFWTTSEIATNYDDPDAPLVLTEFGGSSITSANAGEESDLPKNDVIRPIVSTANPLSLRFIDAETHGYAIVDLAPTAASVTYVAVPIATHGPRGSTLARYELDLGDPTVRQVEGDHYFPRAVPVDAAPEPTPSTPADGAGAPPVASGAIPVSGSVSYTG